MSNIPALLSVLRLAVFIRRERILLLHTTDRPRDAAFTTLLARLTGAGVVLHVHVKWTAEIGRAAHWAAEHARALVGISRFSCDSLTSGGISSERVFLAHNATDLQRFNPQDTTRGTFRSRLGVDESVPLVGIIGRFTIWKGHLDLVTAFALVRQQLPHARLVIVGRATPQSFAAPDDYVTAIKRRIDVLELGDAVQWVDWTEDVPALIADLDIMAIPSFEEPFGLVATECMAMERPVVGYASGALPEIVTDGVEGLLVPVGDTEALGKALVDLLLDPARRATMGKLGRQRVIQQFGPPKQAEAIARLYRALVEGEAVPRA